MSHSIISHHFITTKTTTNRHQLPLPTTFSPHLKPTTLIPSLSLSTRRTRATTTTTAAAKSNTNPKNEVNDDVEEVEEDMPWIQEKALDIVEFSGSVTQALPGPRVGQSKVPWLLALPLVYVGVSF
ncbi:hypothetical protein Tco_1331610, partial [Tanacetum coccineum]